MIHLTPRKRQTHHESNLQQACVIWFRYLYPQYRLLLFHIPNGGYRNIATAENLKKEGVVSGVADLFFSVAKNGYHGLYIEMKAGAGVLSLNQAQFNEAVVQMGYKYEVCRSLYEFEKLINEYLK